MSAAMHEACEGIAVQYAMSAVHRIAQRDCLATNGLSPDAQLLSWYC